jgi:hypothetical protein
MNKNYKKAMCLLSVAVMALLTSCGEAKEVAVEDTTKTTDTVLKAYQGGEVAAPDSESISDTLKASLEAKITQGTTVIQADASINLAAAVVKASDGTYQAGASGEAKGNGTIKGFSFGSLFASGSDSTSSVSSINTDITGNADIVFGAEISDKTYLKETQTLAYGIGDNKVSNTSANYAYASQKMADYLAAADVTDIANSKMPKVQLTDDDVTAIETEFTSLQTNKYISYTVTQNSSTKYYTFAIDVTKEGFAYLSDANLVEKVNSALAAASTKTPTQYTSYLEKIQDFLSSYTEFTLTIPATAKIGVSLVLTDKFFPVSAKADVNLSGTAFSYTEKSDTDTPNEKQTGTLDSLVFSFEDTLAFKDVTPITLSADDKALILSKGKDITTDVASSLSSKKTSAAE